MPEEARREIWHGLLFGQRSMMLRFASSLKSEFGLTLAQFEALQVLSTTGNDSMTATSLSKALLYSSGSTTNLIKQLEKLGLVRRTPCPDDARVVLISLTEQGKSVGPRAAAAHRERIEREFYPLVADEDLAALVRFSQRYVIHEDLTALPHFPGNRSPASPGSTHGSDPGVAPSEGVTP